jgi:hypothetical protein
MPPMTNRYRKMAEKLLEEHDLCPKGVTVAVHALRNDPLALGNAILKLYERDFAEADREAPGPELDRGGDAETKPDPF